MLVDPQWEEWADSLAGLNLAVLTLGDLLEHEVVRSTMTYADLEVLTSDEEWLLGSWPYTMSGLLDDEPPTAVHHLFGLMKFSVATGVDWRYPQTVIEWGGGYGGMARLAQKMCPDTRWTIIDLPVMLEIQRRHSEAEAVSVYALDYFDPKPPDVFVATHSISESPAQAQDLVIGNRFFDAVHYLFAYRHHPDFASSARWCKLAPTFAPAHASPVIGEIYGFR